MRQLVSVCVVLLFMLVSLPAYATQVVYQTPRQLGKNAELVVVGKVTGVESYWNTDHTKILTRTSVTIEETFKGSGVASVDIIQLGGVVGTVRVTVSGALAWHVEEEVVLFLEPARGDTYQVTGFSQGKFEVFTDPETGRRFVNRPALNGIQLINVNDGEADKAVESIGLESFMNHVFTKPSGQ